MEKFEKWIEQKTFYNKDTELHIAAFFAWKAALKWVQSGFEFGSNIAYSTDDILIAVKKEIKEELKD